MASIPATVRQAVKIILWKGKMEEGAGRGGMGSQYLGCFAQDSKAFEISVDKNLLLLYSFPPIYL